VLTARQYLDALKRFTPDQASQDFRTFLDELDEAGATQPEGHVDWLQSLQNSTDLDRKNRGYTIQRAADAREKIRSRQKSSDAGNGVRIWNGRAADAVESGLEMERDFTTPGTPGRLYCPFVPPNKREGYFNLPSVSGQPRGISTPRSSMSRTSGRRSKRSSFHDPIRAEMCGQGVKDPSVPPSVDGSAPLCPIRFLNQHSPEEVAKYFETHKHEVPRSHAVCVKRYQSNEASIRQLDAKYGNLVNMIQGLGEKHQPLLPEVDDEAVVDEDGEVQPQSRVQNWAKAVSVSLENNVDEPQTAPVDDDDDRLSHFDRPLKDVRVGESPSRPWGITVPERYAAKSGVMSTRSDPTASPLETPMVPEPESPVKGKCPFDHKNMEFDAAPPQPALGEEAIPQPQTQTRAPTQAPTQLHPSPPPAQERPPFTQPTVFAEDSIPSKPGGMQMVFNGPVFFGYGMEQALALLQQSNCGNKQ
jgi:hypothetical protein